MSEANKNKLEVMKFIFSIVISILIAALGYLMTNKLEAIEDQLSQLNKAINTQMVINKENEMRLENHEIRIEQLEEQE